MSGERILIAHDCLELRRDLTQLLNTAGEDYDVTPLASVADIPLYCEPPKPDLVVLGCWFDGDSATALEPCRRVRRMDPAGEVSLLVIATGLLPGQPCGAVAAGAQACLPVDVLTRRSLSDIVRHVLKEGAERRGLTIVAGPFVLVRDGLLVRVEGRLVDLTDGEFTILWKFARRAGEYVRAQDFAGERHAPSPSNYRKQVSRLREKLGSARLHIKTARGRGYMLDIP